MNSEFQQIILVTGLALDWRFAHSCHFKLANPRIQWPMTPQGAKDLLGPEPKFYIVNIVNK
jgi:hypothetical protein